MKVYKETDLKNFERWGGAHFTMQELTFEQMDILQEILEDLFPDGIEETALNDILSYEEDWIAEMLGFEDFEDLTNQAKEREPF